MSNVTKEIRLIMVEAGENHNKWWTGELHDDGSVVTRWGRVGGGEQSKRFPGSGESFLLKKKAEKEKKGYRELKTVKADGNNVSVNPVSGDLQRIAIEQISGNNPVLTKLIERLVKANVHQITSSTNIQFNQQTGLLARR